MVETPTFEHTLKFKVKDSFQYGKLFTSLNFCRRRYNKKNNTFEDFILSRSENFEVTLMINQSLLQVMISELIRMGAI